jgi:alpha-glucosidase
MIEAAPSIVPMHPPEKDWWRGAVLYQIYTRSFQDSTGDGIGDLAGIAQRLPYVASLGVDAIWLTPFFTSPMKDFGYDVSDYCGVDPLFGHLSDFDLVVETAHGLGLRVIIDQVLSHTSDQHLWFSESRQDRTNPKADWYVWADPKPDGTAPNNWLSIFGGSAWQWDSRRMQYYLHNFLVEQPDLNFHNNEVQDALLDTCRFWLDHGVDGVRLDTINFYFADRELRDNPPLAPELRNATIAPAVNPYNHQDHVYSKNQPENMEFLARLRSLLDEYPATTAVGEVGDALRGLELLGEYTTGDEHIHMCYAFECLSETPLTADNLSRIFARVDEKVQGGWPCWAFSNHDVQRHTSRWDLTLAAQRLYTTLMTCLRGSLCLYQGEELGLPEADIAFDDLQDPYGVAFWPEFKGRDGCRTPMVWESGKPHGGFTTGRSWLPVSSQHMSMSVDVQENDPASLLHHYRSAIAFRNAYPALVKGEQSTVTAVGDVVVFNRTLGNQTIFCAFNISDQPATIEMPTGHWQQIGAELGSVHPLPNNSLCLGPWQPSIAIIK